MRLVTVLLFLGQVPFVYAQQSPNSLAEALLLHASFDRTADADFARGDGRVYTAPSLKRNNPQPGLHSDAVRLTTDQGRYGGCLAFSKKGESVVFFRGLDNLPRVQAGFQGSYCFWMRLSPDEDLPAGYVDPLQITDKKWNDAAFYVDFTQAAPRKFRLGVFSDYQFWNESNRKWGDIPESERPLVTVDTPPFSRDRWVHVGITFQHFNQDAQSGEAVLYLNGESQGVIRRPQQFTWDASRVVIMLGIYYVGQIDDLAIFDRSLSAAEIKHVLALPQGIHSLGRG